MYKKASRLKVRFETKRGNLSVEDLWDLPLVSKSGVSLDDVAKNINREIKANEEESFVVEKSTKNTVLEMKLDIVKDIIKDRLVENEERRNAAAKKEKKETILAIIADKENEALKNKSVDELKKELEDM